MPAIALAPIDCPLTEKQQRLIEWIDQGCSTAEAARRAGYSARSAGVTGSKMLALAKVQRALTQLRAARVAEVEPSKRQTLLGLAANAYNDPADLFDDNQQLLPIKKMPPYIRRAIQRIRVDPTTGKVVEVHLANRNQALMLLGRYDNLFDQPIPPPADDGQKVAGLDYPAAVELIQRQTPGLLERPPVRAAETVAQPVNGNGKVKK